MAKVRCILLVRSGAEVSQRSFELTQFPQSPLEIISLLKQQDLRLQTMAFDVSVACPAEKKLQKLANSNQVALFFAKVTTEMTFDVTLTGSGSTSASRLLTSQYLDDDLLRLHIFAPRTDSEDKGQTVDQHTEKMFVIPATGLGVALGRAARDTRQDGFAIRLERIVVFLMDDKKSCVAGKALPDNDKELREMLQTCARSGKPLRITYEVLPPSSPRTIMSDAASPLGRPAHSSGFSSAHPRSAAPSTGSAASPTVAASASPRSSGPSASATKSIPASSPKPTSSSVPKPATSTPPTATSNGSPPSATVTPPSRAPVTPAPIPQSPPPASTTTAPKAAPSSSGAATKHTANLPAKVPPASSTATQATSAPPTSSTAKPKSAAPKSTTSRPATVTRTKSNDTTKSGEAHADPPRNAVASIRIQHPALLEDHQLTFSYSKTESELLHRFRDSCVSTVSKPTKGKPAEYFKVVVISGGEHHTITTDGDLREWIALSKESNRPLRVVLQPVSSRRSPSAGREPSPSGTAAHPKDPPSARPVSKQTPTALAPEKAASPPPPPLEEDLHTPTAAERNSTAAAVKLPEIKTPAKTVEPRTPSVRKESGGSTQSITSTEKLPDVRSSPSQLSPSNLESPRVQLSSLPNVQNATLPKANSAPPTHAVSTTSPPAPRSASVTTPRGVIPTRSTASTAQGSPERGSDPLSGKVELQQFAEIDSRPASQHPVLGSVGSSSITMSATEVRPPQSSPQGSPPRSARAEGRRRMLAKSEYFKVVAPSGLDPVLPARDVASCIAMNAAGDCLFQSFARWNEQESLILCRLSGSSLLQDLKRALCQEFEVDESVAPEIRIFLQELGGDVVEDSEIASDEALRSRLKLLTVSAAMLAVKCSSHPNPPTSESTKPHLKELVRELSVELTSRLGHEFRVSQLQALLTPCEGNTEQIPGSKKFFDHLKAMPEAILRVSDEEVDSFLHLCFKGLDSSVAREVAHACVMRMTVFNLGSPMESLRCFFARFHRSMKVAPHGSVVPVFFTMCETHNLEMPITAEEALSESKFCGAVMEKFATDPTSIMNVFSTSAMEQLFPRRNRELRTPEEQEVLRTVFQEELKHCFDEWSIQQLEACIQSEEIRREPAVQTLLSVIGALLAGSPMANYVQWLVDHFRGRLASVLFAKMKTFETADGLPMQTLVHSCWELMRPELELNFLAQKQGEVAALGLWAFFAVQLECLNRHTSFPALPPYNSIPRQTSVVRAATLPLATAIKRGSSAGSSRPAPSTGDVVKAKKNKVQYIYKYYCSDLRTPHLPVANEEAKSGSPKLPSSA